MVVRHPIRKTFPNGSGHPETITVEDRDHGTITMSYEFVSPETAREWLENHNRRNRRIRKTLRNLLARAMEDGDFINIPQPISFDSEGSLLDGQHRLAAVVQSGKGQWFWVARGYDPITYDYVDQGTVRTASDLLERQGVSVTPSMLAAALNLLFQYRSVGHFGKKFEGTARRAVSGHLEKEPGIEVSVAQVGRYSRLIKTVRPGLTAALYHLFRELSSDEEVDAFFEQWATGLGLESSHDPVHALRTRLENSNLTNSSNTDNWKAAHVIKAWNAYRTGKPVQVLRWSPREKFPKPI